MLKIKAGVMGYKTVVNSLYLTIIAFMVITATLIIKMFCNTFLSSI